MWPFQYAVFLGNNFLIYYLLFFKNFNIDLVLSTFSGHLKLIHRIIIIESRINIKPLIGRGELGGGIVDAAFVRGEKSRKGCEQVRASPEPAASRNADDGSADDLPFQG